MHRTGRVVELTVHHMRLALDPLPACSSCQSRAGSPGCGGLFSAWWQQSRQRHFLRKRQSLATRTPRFFFEADAETLDLDRLRGVAIGDRVRVDINPVFALKLAFIAYCVPVILLLAGAVAGRLIVQVGSFEGPLAILLSPALGIMGFVGGLFAYRPLVNDLLDTCNRQRDTKGRALLRTSQLLGPG